jgi:MarR family transcriptional regulator, multiple antibiotic resistance protein MarR
MFAWAIISSATNILARATIVKSSGDLFNEIIPLGRLIHMVNQKKDRLLNDYLSPQDITATQFKVLCSIRCEVCVTPVELKKVLSVDLGALTRMLDRLVCKGWVERLPNPNDKRGVLVRLTPEGTTICEQCHQLVGQDLHQELTKNLSADEVATLEYLLKKVLP